MAAARCPALEVWCVDCDAATLALVRAARGRSENAAFAARVQIAEGDVAAPPQTWRPPAPRAQAVMMNPPFTPDGAGRRSPDAARQRARGLTGDGLAPWLLAARRLLVPGGFLAVVAPPALLPQLPGDGFGATRVFPILSRADAPARRVVVTARLGRRSPLALMPPIVMHDRGGRFSAAAERILSGTCDLAGALSQADA